MGNGHNSEQRRFRGTLETGLRFAPWMSVAPPLLTGAGVHTFVGPHGDHWYWDGWELKVADKVNSTLFLILGEKGAGKTMLAHTLCLQGFARQCETLNGYPERARILINDRRRLPDGTGEYYRITNLLEGTHVVPSEPRSINPFHGLTEKEMLEIGFVMCEMDLGRELLPFEALALQVAVRKMATQIDENDVGPEALAYLIRNLGSSDLTEYFREVEDAELIGRMKNSVEATNSTVSSADVILAGCELNALFNRLLNGDRGRCFGQGPGLQDKLRQHFVRVDWSDTPQKTQAIIEEIFWRWRKAAQDRGDRELIPHYIFSDEAYKPTKRLEHLRVELERTQISRTLRTVEIKVMQYLSDQNKVGSEGSEHRALAESIELGIGGFFIGKMQTRRKRVQEALYEIGLESREIEQLPSLAKGMFGFKAPGHPVSWFYNQRTSTESELLQTDTASIDMANPRDASDFSEVVERAKKVGIIIGGDAE